jgi:peptidoglycan/xylan/chitin deacetylase (PgdA/CDA1 family)
MPAQVLIRALLTVLAIAHPQLSNPLLKRQSPVPFGSTIYACTQPGAVAVTFDDGPYIYTNSLLEKLAATNHKVTFFQNGQNWASIYDYQPVLQTILANGHQIGHHTWSHEDLTTLNQSGVDSQISLLEEAFLTLIGIRPACKSSASNNNRELTSYIDFRFPYFSSTTALESYIGGRGYHIIQCDVDTLDYQYGPLGQIATSEGIYSSGINSGDSISLEHDTYDFTVNDLAPYIFQFLDSKGLTSVTIGQCLGDPPGNWYYNKNGQFVGSSSVSTSTTTRAPVSSASGSSAQETGKVDPGGSCGVNGFVCATHLCCSQYGYCGVSTPTDISHN